MTEFRIVAATPLDPGEAWRRVTDWPRHAMPFTAVRSDGRTVAARTGLGRLGFEDVMDVVRWEPPQPGRPGTCRLAKRGPLVLGWAEIEVRPHRGGALVRWREDLRIAPLPALFDRPTAWCGRLLFRRTLRALLR
ncbi:SRPBCC family protein [Kitasatospora sp. NA04385]|uniref:SRPBCC family protein n=1 Tax=Kitasatospora sp. NA04385 TaxID=2742135 RepID=UPI00158FD679|nr:SRPBCC family protein [Kitasatospora sp. NA04385]QKW23605.1 SRPBCC family protein [Kitasatospora sp. NA04385]